MYVCITQTRTALNHKSIRYQTYSPSRAYANTNNIIKTSAHSLPGVEILPLVCLLHHVSIS